MAPRAWPFAEAERILERRPPNGGRPILFQTGYGPSGLPHIGTFAEVGQAAGAVPGLEQDGAAAVRGAGLDPLGLGEGPGPRSHDRRR